MRDRTLLWNGAHLAVLSAFALAQPLFSLLGKNPEFFAARGSTSFEIILFAVLLVLVPPALLLLVEFLVGLASPRARDATHLAFVALAVALIVIQPVNDIEAADPVLIALALVLAIGLTVAYWRTQAVPMFVSVLSPAPLVFLVLFLFVSPVSKLTVAGEARAQEVKGVDRVPVVMVLFDELPTTSLMDARGGIDAERFPAFARLAGDGIWFRNAYTIYDSTAKAIPAILDGNLPEEGSIPISADHPRSLFTLLGRSHRMNVSEEATTLCPRDLCGYAGRNRSFGDRFSAMSEDLGLVWLHVVSPPDIEAELPTVSDTWGQFGGDDRPVVEDNRVVATANLAFNRPARFERFVRDVRASRRPSLNFKHVLLPHVPWEYLPSGLQYSRGPREPVTGLSNHAYENRHQLDQLHLRHLLQLRYTDAQLGRLLGRLDEQGIYDEALIVVAADHGVAFNVGARDRRRATDGNVHQIAPVPLLIKRPGQERGRIDDSYVETIDILPTIAETLSVELPDEPDGVSAFSETVRRRAEIRLLRRDLSGFIRLDAEEFERRKAELLARKIELFGVGAEGERRMFRFGPNAQLVGRPAAAAGPELPGVSLVHEEDYEGVDRGSGYVPAHVVARVDGPAGQEVAIAVNGTIVAVSSTFTLATAPDDTILAVMIPEDSLHEGANEVQVLKAP